MGSRIDFEKLNLVAVEILINVAHLDEEKTIQTLKKYAETKIILRTFGFCNLVVILFCTKGEEGGAISEMRSVLEKLNVTSFKFCIGFGWEKLDLSPF